MSAARRAPATCSESSPRTTSPIRWRPASRFIRGNISGVPAAGRSATMSDRNTAARAGFQNAEAYERFMGRWSRRLAPLLIRFAGLADGERVLDVGCGTGSLTSTLAEATKLTAIPGVDLPPGLLDFARARNTDPRIASEQADARELPFEDKS